MKRRFLPISLFLTIIILAQTNFAANAHGESGKYNPRSTTQATVESFMKSIRANQETGLIDPAWLLDNSSMTRSRESGLDWTSLGPDNYGSLTRAIVYDKKDASGQTIYIGTMGGGVFRSTNGGITWKSIGGNMMVNTMAQTKDGNIFVGTGDGREAHKKNGLSDLSYSTSFNGSGIYMYDKETDNFVKIDKTSEWLFVNELAAHENTLYAATDNGLFSITTDNIEGDWTEIMPGKAYNVEVCSNGLVLALVDNLIYRYNPENTESPIELVTYVSDNDKVVKAEEGYMLPVNTSYKIIAASPSDPDYVYVAYIDKNKSDTTTYKTGNIYVTRNFTDELVRWDVAYTVTNMYDLFGSNGLIDHALTVHPKNPKKIFIGGADLWVAEDKDTDIYRIEKISTGSTFQISNSGGVYIYNYSYIHTGIQGIVFNPNNANEFFIGSNGGIFKGGYKSNTGYTFEGRNRYFIDENNHTSAARMFSVGFSGNNTVIGGSLDHGTIKVIGDPTLNNVCTGNGIFPNDQTNTDASMTYGSFNYTMSGGPCAISTINPNAMFITTTGDFSIGTSLFRTQSSGVDYDKDNFSYSVTDGTPYIYAPKAFRTPVALYENYNDIKSIDSVMIYAVDTTLKKDTTVVAFSLNSDYPFDYKLTEDLAQGDSIKVQDIISSTLITAAREKNTTNDVSIYMTKDALKFSKVAEWWKLGTVSGTPNCITISQDGNTAFVGTTGGKLYKYDDITEGTTKLAVEGDPGKEDSYTYIFDSIPDESVDWDTTYIYNKIIIDSIISGDTVWMEVVYDTVMHIDTVWKELKDVIVDSVFVAGKEAIPSLISTTEINSDVFNGQAITSVSVDPKNNNNVLVTLGNYGNENYVFYSTDGGNTFNSIQGNLAKMPVYSGIIAKTTDNSEMIVLGTEKGIYTSTDRSNWTLSGLADIPVMEIKQQTQQNRHDRYKYLVDEVGAITTITYPGVSNEGAIFAATYGKGLFRCDEYLVQSDNTDVNVEEKVMTSNMNVSIYPNPVVNEATISFEMDTTCDVTYQIYDLSGRMVSRVSLGKLSQGTHNVNFNVNDLNAGTYIVKVQVGETVKTSKILVY